MFCVLLLSTRILLPKCEYFLVRFEETLIHVFHRTADRLIQKMIDSERNHELLIQNEASSNQSESWL